MLWASMLPHVKFGVLRVVNGKKSLVELPGLTGSSVQDVRKLVWTCRPYFWLIVLPWWF